MKFINVVKSSSEKAQAVWFDTSTGILHVSFGSIVRGLRFDLIPVQDFESTADLTGFSIGQGGAVIVCHHLDGEETWLPIDMWERDGFTPPKSKVRGKKRDIGSLPVYSQRIIEHRLRAGITQSQAAKAAGISQRTLQQWEQGRQHPPEDRIKKILENLAVIPGKIRAAR
ncbi:hypothetical protein BH09VER1_BH09VER1_50250 [soil metagenome]